MCLCKFYFGEINSELASVGMANLTEHGPHACVIFLLFCTNGFSLLLLNHGSNSQECGTDIRSCFGRFSLWHSPFTENSSTEQFRLGCHVITPTAGFLITVTMVHFQTSILFAATVIFLPIPQQYYQKFTFLDGELPLWYWTLQI